MGILDNIFWAILSFVAVYLVLLFRDWRKGTLRFPWQQFKPQKPSSPPKPKAPEKTSITLSPDEQARADFLIAHIDTILRTHGEITEGKGPRWIGTYSFEDYVIEHKNKAYNVWHLFYTQDDRTNQTRKDAALVFNAAYHASTDRYIILDYKPGPWEQKVADRLQGAQ